MIRFHCRGYGSYVMEGSYISGKDWMHVNVFILNFISSIYIFNFHPLITVNVKKKKI